MPCIEFQKVCYSYDGVKNALRNTRLEIEKGEFVAVLGANGCGKSTLAKHMNGLFVPDSGTVIVAGMDTKDPENTLLVRSTCGMVFQNPDDQMVNSVVEDDVAFGPENLGMTSDEIRERVREGLNAVQMQDFARRDPNSLSGGQKQRVAVAGILAMKPDIIVFDEPGAMLDPRGRRGIRRTIQKLHESGITVILITHFMQEALLADRVVVMNNGKVVLSGTPDEVFSHEEELTSYSLEVPLSVKLAHALQAKGVNVHTTSDLNQLKEELCRLYSTK